MFASFRCGFGARLPGDILHLDVPHTACATDGSGIRSSTISPAATWPTNAYLRLMTIPPRIVFARKPKPTRKPAVSKPADPPPARVVVALSPQKIARLHRPAWPK